MIKNEEIKVLEKKIVPFVKKADSIVVTDEKSMSTAVEALSVINKYADEVKNKKESITKPMMASLKAVRSLFLPLESQLDEAIDSLRGSMSSYQTEQKRIADNEAKKIASRIGEGKGKLSIETASKKMESINKPEAKVVTSSGSATFVTVKKFRIMDNTMIPFEYLVVDEVKVRKAMLAGVAVPGVEYYEEQSLRNKR